MSNFLDQPSLYNNGVYGSSVYPADEENLISKNDGLDESILFFTWRIITNNAQYFEGEAIRSSRYFYNKIELKWNFVKGAIGYSIYKGNNKEELNLIGFTKENFYYVFELSENSVSYYQIRPLFEGGN